MAIPLRLTEDRSLLATRLMKLISLRLPEKLEEKLEKYARKLERSKSYLIRKAVEYYLENLSKVSEDVLKLAVSPVAKDKAVMKVEQAEVKISRRKDPDGDLSD